MSKVIAVTGMVLLVIVLLNTSSPAAPASSLVSRVAALEALVASGGVLAPDLTVIRGDVLYDGTVNAGEGFTVAREAEGKYYVSFGGAFSGPPTILLNAFDSDPSEAYVDSWTRNGFHVLTNSKGDWSFRFIAIGPR